LGRIDGGGGRKGRKAKELWGGRSASVAGEGVGAVSPATTDSGGLLGAAGLGGGQQL